MEGAQATNNRISALMNLKQLQINVDKSSFVLIGNTQHVKQMRDLIKNNPITFNNEEVKERTSEKYLGEQIHSEGLKKSVEDTVNKRYWRAISAVMEIRTILNDCRIHKVGGANAGISLWEGAVIPMVLNNAGVWTDIGQDTIDKLNKIRNVFLCHLLATPRTTPLPMLNWDSGCLPMEYRIMEEKLSLGFHISNLNPETLANQILTIQKKYNFPVLMRKL